VSGSLRSMNRSLLLSLAVAATAGAQPFSLHVEADPLPPGAMAQVRVYLRGGAASSVRFEIALDGAVFGRIESAEAHSASGDQFGIAAFTTSSDTAASVRIFSALSGLGRLPDWPVATFGARVLASAPDRAR